MIAIYEIYMKLSCKVEIRHLIVQNSEITKSELLPNQYLCHVGIQSYVHQKSQSMVAKGITLHDYLTSWCQVLN